MSIIQQQFNRQLSRPGKTGVDWYLFHYFLNLTKKYPAIEIAKEVGALASGPTIMNAANESAVSAFIEGKLSFVGIMDVVSRVLDTMSDVSKNEIRSFDDVSAIEENARMRADHIIQAGGN